MTEAVTYAQAPRCGRCTRLHLTTLPCWASTYAARLVAATLATKGRTCWLCGEPGADSADHRIPRSYGGDDSPENLWPAHGRCNSERGNAPPPGLAARLTVVTGEPVKARAWVDDRAQPGDLVVDHDALVRTLVARFDDAPPELVGAAHTLARRARAGALAAAYRLMAGPTVYVVEPEPSPERRRAFLAHGATFHDVGGSGGHRAASGATRPFDRLEPPLVEGSSRPSDLVPDGASRQWLSDGRTA